MGLTRRAANALWLVGAAGALAVLKRAFSDAPAESFRWLLTPATVLAGALTRLEFRWEEGVGYRNAPLHYTIVPACSGLTFFLAAAGTLFTFLALPRHTSAARAAWTAGALAGAYLTTLFANTVRLATALEIHRHHLSLAGLSGPELHRLVGLAVYLLALLALVELARAAHPGRKVVAMVVAACAWYLGMTLGLPLLQGRGTTAAFATHAAWLLGTLALLVGTRLAWAARPRRQLSASG